MDNELFNLGFSGYKLAWCNNREGEEEEVEERLDRFYVSNDWSFLFFNAVVTHIDSNISDHLPIFLRCNPVRRRGGDKAKKIPI